MSKQKQMTVSPVDDPVIVERDCAIERMVEVFREADLPEGVFQYLHLTHESAARVIQSPEVEHAAFTGSVPVGTAIEQAIELMNDSEFGLTASVSTRGLQAAETIGEQVDTGARFMNRCDDLDPALARTGVKSFGRGRTLSRVGYESLTRPKSFHLRTAL